MRRPDDEQVSAALGGDERALERLVTAWLPQVCAWCARLGAPDPEEAGLDVLFLLVRRRDRVDGPEHLPPWLFATCRKVTANQRKRAWWRRWLPGASVDSPVFGDLGLEERDTARLVARALDQIDALHREVLVLCYFEDRSVDEAAELMGVPPGTVKSRLFHARRRFEDVYRRDDAR
jgi:RNA polymerase sigma-70 factor, ECF subfamily